MVESETSAFKNFMTDLPAIEAQLLADVEAVERPRLPPRRVGPVVDISREAKLRGNSSHSRKNYIWDISQNDWDISHFARRGIHPFIDHNRCSVCTEVAPSHRESVVADAATVIQRVSALEGNIWG